MNKELDIAFYGNTFIPVSTDCYGCEHFNFICGGSLTIDQCPTGEVEDMRHSHVAYTVWSDQRVNRNNFLLARINGHDLTDEEHLKHVQGLEEKIAKNEAITEKKDYVDALREAVSNYHKAVSTDATVVAELKGTHYLEDLFVNDGLKEFEQNPRLEELADDDLPF